jgi:hypothetical protein
MKSRRHEPLSSTSCTQLVWYNHEGLMFLEEICRSKVLMETKPIIPFTCEICKNQFHELAGAKCVICGKLVCRAHYKHGTCTECYKMKLSLNPNGKNEGK